MTRKKRIAIALAVSSLAVFAGCGKSDDGASAANVGGVGSGVGGAFTGCLNIDPNAPVASIPFSGQGFKTVSTIYAGRLPQNSTNLQLGQMGVNIGAYASSYESLNGPDGKLYMTVSSANGQPLAMNQPVNVTGVITLTKVQALLMSTGYFSNYGGNYGGGNYYPGYQGYGMPPQPTPPAAAPVCISGVGFEAQPDGVSIRYTKGYIFLNVNGRETYSQVMLHCTPGPYVQQCPMP